MEGNELKITIAMLLGIAATITVAVSMPVQAVAPSRSIVLSIKSAPGKDLAPTNGLSATQSAWLLSLEKCESSGNPKAINPKDKDGTPSYGLLQFKPATLAMYQKRYGIKGQLMDPATQVAVAVEMIKDADAINWKREFPGCVKKLGTPPKY